MNTVINKRRISIIVIALLAVSLLSAISNPVAASNPTAMTQPTSTSSPNIDAPEVTRIGELKDGLVSVTVTFNERNSEGLQKLVSSVDRTGAGGAKPITENQFEAEYSPTQTDYNLVVSFLARNNLAITGTSANRLLIQASGSVKDVEKAFNVEIDLFRYQGMTFYMNSKTIQNPALTPLGVAAVEISNFTAQPTIEQVNSAQRQEAAAQDSSPVDPPMRPSTLWNVYGTANAINGGYTGTGETIGIVDAFGDPSIQTDLNAFDSLYGLPSCTLTILGTGGINENWSTENALDVEWAHAMAPGAAIILELTTDSSNSGLINAVNALVTSANPPNIISCSWSWPEDVPTSVGWGAAYTSAYSSVFSAAASKGIDVYVASGDYGAYDPWNKNSVAVYYPASDPNVVAVGGTTLTVSGGQLSSETGWFNYLTGQGSGGGHSTIFTEPMYQSSAGISDSVGMRGVPDVALDADPNTGVDIIVEGVDFVQTYGLSGLVGGTSLATPCMAGIDAVSLNGYGLHLNNWNMYATLDGGKDYSSYDHSFYDVTSGGNEEYSAESYWDPVTGLGSILLAGYVNPNPSKNIAPMSIMLNPSGTVIETGNPTGVSIMIGVYAVSPNAAHPVTSVQVTCGGSSWSVTNNGGGYWGCEIKLPVGTDTVTATAANSVGQATTSASITIYVYYQGSVGHGPRPELLLPQQINLDSDSSLIILPSFFL